MLLGSNRNMLLSEHLYLDHSFHLQPSILGAICVLLWRILSVGDWIVWLQIAQLSRVSATIGKVPLIFLSATLSLNVFWNALPPKPLTVNDFSSSTPQPSFLDTSYCTQLHWLPPSWSTFTRLSANLYSSCTSSDGRSTGVFFTS